jgi:uncharacterized protein YjiS (DUF1127 family)
MSPLRAAKSSAPNSYIRSLARPKLEKRLRPCARPGGDGASPAAPGRSTVARRSGIAAPQHKSHENFTLLKRSYLSQTPSRVDIEHASCRFYSILTAERWRKTIKLLKSAEFRYANYAWLDSGIGTFPKASTRLCCTALAEAIVSKGPTAESFKMEGQMTSLKSIAEKLNAWRRYREAVRELEQMTDRELEDIGIRRGDIPYVVRGAIAE